MSNSIGPAQPAVAEPVMCLLKERQPEKGAERSRTRVAVRKFGLFPQVEGSGTAGF